MPSAWHNVKHNVKWMPVQCSSKKVTDSYFNSQHTAQTCSFDMKIMKMRMSRISSESSDSPVLLQPHGEHDQWSIVPPEVPLSLHVGLALSRGSVPAQQNSFANPFLLSNGAIDCISRTGNKATTAYTSNPLAGPNDLLPICDIFYFFAHPMPSSCKIHRALSRRQAKVKGSKPHM